MSRKSLFLALCTGIVLLGGVSGGLVWALRVEPDFYLLAETPPGAARLELSGEFFSKFTNDVVNGILNEQPWSTRFTQDQVNSYLEEDFIKKHSTRNPLPEGVSNPRFVFQQEEVLLGFRYGSGAWNSVVSVRMRPWLVQAEPNTVALEILSLRAGVFPISPQTVLNRVAELSRSRDFDIAWFRHNGHPVVLLRFQSDRPQPTFLLQKLEVSDGTVRVAGKPVSSRRQPQNKISG